MKTIFTKEAKIGIVSIISLTLLYFGINYLKGINLFQPSNHYEVIFNNVKGVTISSPVYVEGFKVGLVRDIRYDYEAMNKITVDISLEDKMRINKGSYITIVNSFLGGAELHIHLNKYVEDYFKPGDQIEGRMTEEMMQELISLAENDKIKFDEAQYNRSKPLIMLQIKALIARDLYDMGEYFQVINDDNPSFQEALRIINDEERYNKVINN